MNLNQRVIFRIFYWLLAVSLLAPLVYSSAFYETFSTSKTLFFYLIVELTLPIYLYLCLRFYGFGHLKNPIVYLSAIFLVLGFLSAVLGIDFIHSFWGNFERMQGLYFELHLFFWLLYLVLLFNIDRKKISFIINILIGIASVSAFIGIIQEFGGMQLSTDFGSRSISLIGNPIFFASFLVIPFFLCFYQIEQRKNYWFLAPATLIFIGIFTTQTAGAVLGIAISLGLGILIYFFEKKIKTTAITTGILAVIALAAIFAIMKIPQLKDQFVGSNAQQRLIEWRVAIKGFTEKPIFGVGPENFSYIANKHIDDRVYQYSDGFFDKPHNYFLEIATTRGILSLLIYLAIIVLIYFGIYKQYKSGEVSKLSMAALAGGLTAYIIQDIFAFDTISSLMTFFLMAAVLGTAFKKYESAPVFNLRYSIAASSSLIILLIFTFWVNINFARASIILNQAINFAQPDPPLAETYFERLENLPFYADAPIIGLQHEIFITNVASSYNVVSGVLSGLLRQSIPTAIAYNQKIADQNSNYFKNELSLAKLYLLKSQLDSRIDPKVYEISALVNKQAPNRIEANFVLIAAYSYENKPDKIQEVMDELNRAAPNSPVVMWEQINVYAMLGKARLVLDKAKEMLAKNNDAAAMAQLDRLASYYDSQYNYQQVMALYNQAIQLYPDNAHFYVELARTYAASGDKATARQIIAKLKTNYPQSYAKYDSEVNQFLQ